MSRIVGRVAVIALGVALPLGSIEIASRLRDAREASTVRVIGPSGVGYAPHDILGYAPRGAARSTVVRTHGSETLYSATYTIGDNGLRVSPRQPGGSAGCALFFGDSFTYGEGVNDDEAMPYVAGVLSGYEVYNFGFPGYGPHQMLAAIALGIVPRVVHCRPRTVVYEAVPDHAWRAAGYAPWDYHGPKFELGSNGLVHEGHFDGTRAARLRLRVRRALSLSSAYRRYVATRVTDQDIKRFVAIVSDARDRLHAMYPSASFHMILWNDVPDNPALQKELDGLLSAGITPTLASAILPGYPEQQRRYEIGPPYDRHPNASTQRLMASYVVSHFLGGESR